MNNGTINGIGLSLCDYRPVAPGVYQTIRCFTVFFVPILPLSIWIVQPRGIGAGGGLLPGRSLHYTLLEERPLDLSSVLRMYGNCLLWAAIAFAPFLLWAKVMKVLPESDWSVVVLVFLIIWATVALFWRKFKNDALYRG